MKNALLAMLLAFSAVTADAAEPDYSVWNRILAAHYNPARGMDYGSLKAKDAAALQQLRQSLGRVNATALDRKQQLAYWINVYNVNVVAAIVERYPVESIRDLSTDPIIRLNVFKKERVPYGSELLSLDDVEHKKVREGFKDPRIHFAINCAAKSCPPIRPEAFIGAKLDAQLDEQARTFLARTVRLTRDGSEVTIYTTKIIDWFGDDFDQWGGGRVAFLRKYLPADKQRVLAAAKEIDVEYDDYDWALNDWKR